MKKIVLMLLAGVLVLGATLGATTSCEKIEHPRELAELGALIADGLLLSESDYTAASWTHFKAALANAERVIASASPTLETHNTAITNLRNAMQALENKDTLREDLATAIEVSEAWPNAGYTEASWKAFQDALTAAKTAYADTSATLEQLAAARDNLIAAYNALVKG